MALPGPPRARRESRLYRSHRKRTTLTELAQAPLYRQREFHQSPLWRLLVDHGEDFLKVNDSRYGESHRPLPLQSAKIMEKLQRYGDPRYGLTQLHCPDCQIHLAVPFSCNVCPSCINRRAEVQSHSLTEKLSEGDYRHLVVTLPKEMGLRKRFQLDTRLHRQIGRVVHRVPSAFDSE